ncbi:MAG: SPOR domain-containing protein [Salibacteraceae bacterium]|nr:SPOR domain-containing protein [Salibacteraceae bacterium]
MRKIVCKYLCLLCVFGISNIMIAQEGTITIKQDLKIDSLLNKKIELDRKRFANEYFTLQLYYGNLSKAKEILKVVREKFSNIPAEINYDNPNYKVQAGRFKNKIKGLKTLDTLKRIFPSAFLLKKKTL